MPLVLSPCCSALIIMILEACSEDPNKQTPSLLTMTTMYTRLSGVPCSVPRLGQSPLHSSPSVPQIRGYAQKSSSLGTSTSTPHLICIGPAFAFGDPPSDKCAEDQGHRGKEPIHLPAR